jgi:hypothetical protein
VVELQRGESAVIPARRAAPAGLLDQNAFYPPPPLRDALLGTQDAPVGAADIDAEDRPPVA